MPRYIVCRECESSDCCGCNIYTLARALVQGKLDWIKDEKNSIQMPTVSPDEVRGVGKWIKYAPHNSDMMVCSACEKYWILDGDQYDYRFCPNCGAKMKGAEDGTTE